MEDSFSASRQSMIAGFISGVRTELARVRLADSKMQLYDRASYTSQDFSSFDSVLDFYLRKHPGEADAVCLGIAGPVIEGEVRLTNVPWRMKASEIAERHNFGQVKLVNDIVAIAHSLPFLDSEEFYLINKGEKVEKGNVGLIAAGWGLGEALIYSDGTRSYPYASEGGHSYFAPATQIEAELWEYIYAEQGYVEVEDVLSLSGLEKIYNFLVDTQGAKQGRWMTDSEDRPGAILERALAGTDETASEVVDIFIDCYASEAGNLALKGMTLGGVYVTGRIAPRILTALDRGRFMERFVKRGKMETLLARIPVGVIIDDQAPLMGAAGIVMKMTP